MAGTSATIKVRNIIAHGPVIEVPAKVGTAATLLVLPQSVTDELALPTIRRRIVKYANEERAERDVVYGVELEICDRKGVFEAIVEPAETYALLGAVVMETLDLIVEPRDLRVYPNPRSKLPIAASRSGRCACQQHALLARWVQEFSCPPRQPSSVDTFVWRPPNWR